MNILNTIGNTPLIELVYFSPPGRKIFAKLEGNNPGGSVKDRIALAMIERAENEGKINLDTVIIEPTSGNTGIGLAIVCAAKGYKCILTMPENMSTERRKMLRHLGADIVLTPEGDGITGAVKKAEELASEIGNVFFPNQFNNSANPAIHRETTGPEIARQLGENISAFVAGVGTGGTITGVAQFLKIDKEMALKVVAVEPEESAVLSGNSPGKHRIQGIGAGFVPSIYNSKLVDSIEKVNSDEAFEFANAIAKNSGIPVGISSGANLVGAIRTARKLPDDSVVVTVFPDRVDRYLSII
ncbi:cysteine synthase A [bacterium]|nr:MAG: cysteine synthase A [bacterium]